MSRFLSRLSSQITPRRLLAWLPLALLGLTILTLFHRLLVGDVLFWGLPSLQFYPWREFAMREFAQGRWPLWRSSQRWWPLARPLQRRDTPITARCLPA